MPKLPARYQKSANKTRLKHAPDGTPLCRQCGTPVKPPKRTFCCEACVSAWKLRTSGTYLRRVVFARDHGICALCGFNAPVMERKLKAALKRSHDEWNALREQLHLTEHEAMSSLWQADHIVPVIEGGGCASLTGLRTLCVTCHKRATAELRRKRAAEKKK
jgi:5-methylcytosine-specific restriction enzyme A